MDDFENAEFFALHPDSDVYLLNLLYRQLAKVHKAKCDVEKK